MECDKCNNTGWIDRGPNSNKFIAYTKYEQCICKYKTKPMPPSNRYMKDPLAPLGWFCFSLIPLILLYLIYLVHTIK